MIKQEKRKAIYTLYQEGRTKKEITRLLRVDRKTVKRIIEANGKLPDQPRTDKFTLDRDLLQKVYQDCEGYVQRVGEVLEEEHGVKVGYSTLTRLVREMEIGKPVNQRCHRVPDVPGAEMQHDTSPYKLEIGGRRIPVVCSGLYYRYCKMRYIKFYRRFTRFIMKGFLHEAFIHFGYTAQTCIIDNTNLAVRHGTGKNAVFEPEMISFAKKYGGDSGFDWLAHEKGHSNRKAGKERNFWTVETNFFPGRKFKSLSDLNNQAFEWATNRYAKRPLSKTRLIPCELFELEKPYLKRLSPYIDPPYCEHERPTDQYGYIAFHSNYYWIPGTSREVVKVLEYPGRIRIYKKRQLIVDYVLESEDVRGRRVSPDGVNTNPYEPAQRTIRSDEEQARLRAIDEVLGNYLDFIKSKETKIRFKHQFIRELYILSKKVAPSLLVKTIQRALDYKVTQMEVLQRVSAQLMKSGFYQGPDEDLGVMGEADLEKRESYRQGRFSDNPDLDYYKGLTEDPEVCDGKDEDIDE